MSATVDTSVAVPACAGWHESHEVGRRALRGVERLPLHVLFESVSVLTRLPGGRALPVAAAVTLVRGLVPGPPLALEPDRAVAVLNRLAQLGIGGGRVYDALVAATAAATGLVLRSLDVRARPTYDALDVAVDVPE